MKLLDKKYYNLEPKYEYLKDSFILGLAWKKTDSFVRTHNWYADILELDKCAFDISDEVTNWSNEISKNALSKSDIELIPAPKGASWFINQGKWTTNKDNRKIRPLANISIRDQSFATAVTMCLADAIETRQKDCSLSNLGYAEHVKNKVVSYGNRLVCDWDNKRARFRWGGSEYYRKFSSDYRSFLQRPIYIGRETVNKVSGIDDVYIISLDLKNFFGSIKINLLLEKIKKISADHYAAKFINDNEFWTLANRILSWDWPEESLSLLESLDIKEKNVGLPQGLASAGALANAYLIEFDESLISKLRTKIEDSQIILHDYCRYVDDIRLVISGEALESNKIKESIHALVQGILDETLAQNPSDNEPYLKINDSKTYILELSDIDNGSGLTNRINEIQHEVGASSIPERNGLDNNIPALQQLLLTEQDNFSEDVDSLFPGFKNDKSIKVESVRRFSAHRLEKSLAKKSKLISPEERKQFDNETSLIAKKLLKAWLKDPSIMVIFRKAIAINPNLDAYSTILEIIFSRIQRNRDKRDKYIMLYLLSDIFRSVIDVYRNLESEYVDDYQKLMGEVTLFAQKILSCKSFIPNYAYQQALFYLAVINKPFIASNKASFDLARLQCVLIKQHLEPLNSSDGYLFEVSAQISKDYRANAAFLLSHTNSNKVVDLIIEKFAFRGGEFWNAIWKEIVRMQDKDRINEFRWAISKYESKPNSSEHYLSSVISFKENPFRYEHALLKLGVALVELFDDTEKNVWQPDGKQYSPHEIKVKLEGNSTSWGELWRPNFSISCSIDKKGEPGKDPRYISPEWLANYPQTQNDEQKIYWVCSVLRSAALGNVDYTQRNDLKLDKAKYDGIHSQFYKRRMGMLHTPESIVGSYGTITDWFASFLQHGLQWPGFSSSYISQEDILSITNIIEFKNCLLERLGYLNKQICISSNVPTLPTVVNRPELASNHFRIVTVQQLFPKDTNFHPSDVTLANPDVRWKHREHLAEICKLTEQTLNAKLKTESREHTSTADLIVFSELAVHPEDEDIVRALAFRTKAIIFSGFVFCEQDGRIVNKARWIIPDSSESGTQWRVRDQGKHHMTSDEVALGIQGYRPSQHIISIEGHPEGPFKLTGAICYDATDIKLAADLRDLTDMFVIAAYNKDVDTFDNMASALQWHMYQHIVITNTGEYGGSTMQAPYKEKYHKLISHAHGTGQIAISTADIDLAAFRRKLQIYKKTKTQPAGYNRKH
ncbi:antiviral reverse transcriptase Drt1a [Klebsiella pneumoniae]|uniref:antiviral reverse transcriptase Drt1a n=1 Tax=Klebsiella pneumoniae TaxID=573 RepID=UPI001ABCE661|nr:antiviral reverse transcriptase Drt1a [Klebsiella pneumoniae]MBO3722539.1 Reverse transcriptase (RNA-dependent DNA polymerase) [Klebsiella pneumoniae]HCB0341043.1 Reverse transcriptase (RNA-dependent DNA polymerase) [Klebsiella pneumoniae]HCB0820966.1 Reverse transcriptase (RNA-dependent DNA polymerase) [Klebsiella pneumoniae]HCM5831293.1 Reverse transcriptase (RNA-dependent DNA polymerase) [Klebsiella pneumoniae]